jgi:phosphate transport system ATP-binding protein
LEDIEMLKPHLKIENLNIWYGSHHALKNINAEIPARGITAIIGPSGCGKTTLLKSLNRLLEETEGTRVDGQILLNGTNIYDPRVDVTEVRSRVGLLASKPFPLPMSIYENVAYGPRIHGRRNGQLNQIVEQNLRAAGLWDEVNDRLRKPASGLSTGQQQRLCLARALAVEPEALLGDEPTSALDPISAQRIEKQLVTLKDKMTIVVVTHQLRQAHRLADHIIFLWLGELVESGPAVRVFNHPEDNRTLAYLQGDIG